MQPTKYSILHVPKFKAGTTVILRHKEHPEWLASHVQKINGVFFHCAIPWYDTNIGPVACEYVDKCFVDIESPEGIFLNL